MTVAFSAVATTTRSILLRDVDSRIDGLLAQETGEFAHFEERGVDPATGQPFGDAGRLLRVFLERQYADPDEELLGLLAGPAGSAPAKIVQDREIPVELPLHRDPAGRRQIFGSTASTGTLHRPAGDVRWAKVSVVGPGGEPEAAFVVAFHPEREQDRADEVFRILLAICGVALLMTTGIGWVVAGRILKPVRLVRTAAAQLTGQDLTRRIPVRGHDDIAALADTFNAMLDRLERAFAAQREFVDDAGHELRTPITIVRGHLELMGDDPAEREETVRLVTDELDRMSRIVEDLLLLAKAERPDFVTPEPVQLAELTADVFVKARTLGDRRWELAEVAEGGARLDPQRITQAMVQLAQNAVQHTVPGQTIRIGSRVLGPSGAGPSGSGPSGSGPSVSGPSVSGARVELYVSDSGPGVQPQDTEVIFERFRRGTARRGTRGSGAGLGLSIVRAIAEGHRGGRVLLRETEGGGATFALLFTLELALETDLEAGPEADLEGGPGTGPEEERT
ncbi:sensor histidine kinase [Streptomyces beigongshangae]|uniref:sensor histidine kinase n=1 Tax=Streptomyces beigongshangae TaxID=2841597 RepID=UPI0021A6C9B6|nr:ATP-binding protein [Streptomyces sp. REN17]